MASNCEICGETFPSEEEHKTHLTSKQHARNTKRYNAKNRQIYVRGFLPGLESDILTNHFSVYGDVRSVHVDKNKGNFAFVEFASESDVSYTLKCPHFLGGRKLFVRKYVNTGKWKVQSHTGIHHQDMMSELRDCETVFEQIETFCTKASLNQADLDSRNNICGEVEKALRKYYPECKIYMFGSTANGFGTKGCDLDLLFEPSHTFWEKAPKGNYADDNKRYKKRNMPFSLSDIDQNLVPYEEFLLQPSHIHVQFVAEVLKKQYDLFRRPIYIPARCPIVNFTHKGTWQHCDLSCSSRLVVCNTQLLRLYSKLDTRVTQILMLLRYWGKYRGLVRPGGLSSYAFSLMVIFFLQNRKPAVLPSVTNLRSNAEEEKMEAGWDCSICTDPDKVGQTANTETVEALILAFFKFYADFDFSFVVSPLMGEVMDRSCFDDLDNLDEQNFKTSPVCIQDPFECSRNVTSFLRIQALVRLKETVKNASLSYEAKLSAATTDPIWGVLSLFADVKAKEDPLCIIPSAHILPIPRQSVAFTLSFNRELKDCLFDVPGSGGVWLTKVTSALLDIFQQGLNFETEVVDQSDSLPIQREKRKHSDDDDDDVEMVDAKKVACMDESSISQAPSSKVGNGVTHNSNEKVCDRLEAKDKSSSVEMDDQELKDNDASATAESSETFKKPNHFIPISCDPQILISIQNIVDFNVWTGRKKYRERNPELEMLDVKGKYLELEHTLSLDIIKNSAKLLKQVFFTCDCYMYREHAHDRMLFVLTPFDSPEDFKPLAYFLKFFIPYLLNHLLR